MIYIVGDSHTGSFDHHDFKQSFNVLHLGPTTAYNIDKHKSAIMEWLEKENFNTLDDWLFFVAGEIDIRCHLGFRAESEKIPYEKKVTECVIKYISFIEDFKSFTTNLGVWAPIPSGVDQMPQGTIKNPTWGSVDSRNNLTNFFNEELERLTQESSIKLESIHGSFAKHNVPYNDWFAVDGIHLNAGKYKGKFNGVIEGLRWLDINDRIGSPMYIIERDYEPSIDVNSEIKEIFKNLIKPKTKVNLYWDKWNFGPQERLGLHPATSSQYLEYTTEPTDIGIFVDYDGMLEHHETIVKNTNHKYKIMVQMEPAGFNRALNGWILENENLFDYILVHYPAWKGTGKYPEKYRYYIAGSRTMILPEDRQLHKKTQNIATIWSHKNYGLVGHNLRHQMRDWLKANRPGVVDFHNPKEKIDVLKDYRYEIVVENEFPYFLTEKHIDAMLTGTLPIIWGNKNTIQWKGFDTNGMVFFESPEELYQLIDSGIFNEEFYLSKKFSMLHNYNEVQKYLSFGDIVWDSIIREIE